MFYKNYVKSIDKKNRKLRNDFLDSSSSTEEFWANIPNIGLVEKYGYDFCILLINLEKKIINTWNNFLIKFLIRGK